MSLGQSTCQLFANSYGMVVISIQLFDARGREVRTDFIGFLSAGTHEWHVSAKELNKGIFYYRVKEHGIR